MNTFVYKRIELTDQSRRELKGVLPLMGWAPGMTQGWVIGMHDKTGLRGRWVYKDRLKLKVYDEETLEESERTIERRMCAPFAIDFERSILRTESAGDAKRIEDALQDIPRVTPYIEPLEIDLQALHEAFCDRFKKTRLEALGIKDVVHEKVLLTDASFTLLDEAKRAKTLKTYGNRLKHLHFVVLQDATAWPVKITGSGKISTDESAPEDTLTVLEDMLLAFHDPAVSTRTAAD